MRCSQEMDQPLWFPFSSHLCDILTGKFAHKHSASLGKVRFLLPFFVILNFHQLSTINSYWYYPGSLIEFIMLPGCFCYSLLMMLKNTQSTHEHFILLWLEQQLQIRFWGLHFPSMKLELSIFSLQKFMNLHLIIWPYKKISWFFHVCSTSDYNFKLKTSLLYFLCHPCFASMLL